MYKTLLKRFIKRGLYSLVILFLLVSFVFILIRLAPGDPAAKYISPGLSPSLSEEIRDSFGLNEPMYVQYLNFISNIFSGDLGYSFNYRSSVSGVISGFFFFTIIFAVISFLLQVSGAIIFALFSAERKGSRKDKFISESSLAVYAVPSFIIGVLLVFIFSELLGIFPSSGLHSYNYESKNFFGKAADLFMHMVLPLLTLTLGGTTVLFRYLRENMDEIFNSDFVLYLRSNGVGGKEILKKHVLPNALGPMISVAGIELGILFSGALVTEVIFGLPGMGRLTVDAILSRDYPLVIGCVMVSGVLIIFSNLAADVVRSLIDKRLLYKGVIT